MLLIFYLTKISCDNISTYQDARNVVSNLKELLESKCFSKIKIDLSQPCKDAKLAKKCTYTNCQIKKIKPEKLENLICRSGEKIGNQCVFNKKKDPNAIFVDLNADKQIYSGYDKGAREIWEEIHKIAHKNKDLSNLISGIHYSISLHICQFYDERNGFFVSNKKRYRKIKNKKHQKNLIFAFKMVKKAIFYLKKEIMNVVLNWIQKNFLI